MPAEGTREIKARIKSVRNTKKITKAMQLVAGAKMRRAVERALSSRDYSDLVWDLYRRLTISKQIEPDDVLQRFFHPASDPKKFLLIVLTSNRGLCGAFNSNVVKKAMKFINKHGQENVEVITIGKKGISLMSVFGVRPVMAYEKDDKASSAASMTNIAAYAYQKFLNNEVDQVAVAYTDFKTAISQEAVIHPLFPFIEALDLTGHINETEAGMKVRKPIELHKEVKYLFEPSKREVLAKLVPRLGEVKLYQALLESNASEHSARMLAMKNATDAAGEMLQDLTLLFNQTRQAAITREIAEISAGMAALT